MMKAAGLLAILFASACLMPPPQGGSGPTYASSGGPSSSGPYSSGNDGSSPSSYGGATPAAAQQSAPAGPVSVDIRSSCPQTVKVFYGDKPKFGSGTYSSISSNSVQSHSFQPGEQLWIVDDSENGVSNATIGSSTRELEINSSCTGISSR